MRHSRHAWAILRVCAFVATACAILKPDNQSKALSISDAKALVHEALPSETKKLPGLSLEPGELQNGGHCVTFDVLWTNPGPGSAHINFYTVDLWNAAVWSGPRPPAKLETGPLFLQTQRRLRRKLGFTSLISEREAEQSPCWR